MTLKLNKISVSVEAKSLVNNITLTVPNGQLSGLIGPNGAGKTTLMRAMAHIIDYDGAMWLHDLALDMMAPEIRAKNIAYMPQGNHIHWPMTVENIVALGRYPHGQTGPEAMDMAHSILTELGISHLKDRTVTSLSGGERSLTLLARTLCVGADTILVDEPTSSLDPKHQLIVMGILKAQAKAGKTVIIIMHDLMLAQRFCDHLILMNNGGYVTSGTSSQVLSDQNLKDVYGIKYGQGGMLTVDS